MIDLSNEIEGQPIFYDDNRIQLRQTNKEMNKESEISKITELGYSVLVVDKKQIKNTEDGSGKRDHYSVFLIAKDNKKIEVIQCPIDIKKYGEIKEIRIIDIENEIILKNTEIVSRLIKYFSTDFATFRKEINNKELDCNDYYPKKYEPFDCQRFSFYLQHGEEGDYTPKLRHPAPNAHFKTDGNKPLPFSFYSITAYTSEFGKNGSYSAKDISKHHYVHLTDNVFVSKYGNSDVLFTSYQHILDAYFPEKFIKGNVITDTW